MSKKTYINSMDEYGTLHIFETKNGHTKHVGEIEDYEELYGPLEDDEGTWLVYPSKKPKKIKFASFSSLIMARTSL